MQTGLEGVFACGNTVQVHDLVDYVTAEGQKAGKAAAAYLKKRAQAAYTIINVKPGANVRYVVPQKIKFDSTADNETQLFFRSTGVIKPAMVEVHCNGGLIAARSRVKVVPSQMEKVSLNREKLVKIAKGQDIIVSIRRKAEHNE